MNQERVEKSAPQEKDETETAPKDLKNAELDEAVEDLVDEIDELLDEARGEMTAEQFCANYLQRGGQ